MHDEKPVDEPTEPTIRLDQFMKLVGLVRSGGQAKHIIQAGQVLVNGVVETRRSRKLRAGDSIEWGDYSVAVELADDE
ncbi:MAG: RNA-binding S4 domain-containing protein [Chloroflexi bacterium]|nr:RNA-binding S4 domain-containing protein [Chloroflexota bacterium]